MRILLSAYACEPGKGSEPEVGWNWASELARRGHEVWVITRANNRPTIEASTEAACFSNLRFIFVDLPALFRRFKKGRRGMTLYYFFWQVAAYLAARRLVRERKIDYVHHVTFVTVRQPSFMGLLGVPFILGPIGGGETTPARLRRSFRLKDRMFEAIRALANESVRLNPLQYLTFATANRIFVTSEQSLRLIPEVFRKTTTVQLAIGIDSSAPCAVAGSSERPLRILFVGNLLHWKGVHLALKAFAEVQAKIPGSKFTIIGEGKAEPWLRGISECAAISDSIEWLGKKSRAELLDLYSRFDLFLYPSLHDSGAMVVLEALRAGLPVIALDLGGPGVVVNETCGRRVCVCGYDESEIVSALAQAIEELASDSIRARLREGARRRAAEFTWSALVDRVLTDCGVTEFRSEQQDSTVTR